MLRGTLASALTLECDPMTGDVDNAVACIMHSLETCEMSTIIPTRFISCTTCFPNGDSPCHSAPLGSVDEPQMSLFDVGASVMHRAPRSEYVLIRLRSLPITQPFSMPIPAISFPAV